MSIDRKSKEPWRLRMGPSIPITDKKAQWSSWAFYSEKSSTRFRAICVILHYGKQIFSNYYMVHNRCFGIEVDIQDFRNIQNTTFGFDVNTDCTHLFISHCHSDHIPWNEFVYDRKSDVVTNSKNEYTVYCIYFRYLILCRYSNNKELFGHKIWIY